MQNVEYVNTKNGNELSASYFLPEGEPKGAILIVSAMGVVQKYYLPFSTWLASQGYVVATFDYSGVGLSQSGNMRDSKVTITDWANYDCAAMIEAISSKSHGRPVYWIGHSLGGQIAGMVPGLNGVEKVISIASGSGYWLENTPSLKWRVWWLWYFVVPLALKLYGYFPGRRLRKVGDLPKGVMCQWRKWCLDPEYMLGVEGAEVREKYRAVVTPISSISFTDDELMSKSNIDSLNSFYSSSKIKLTRINPSEVGVEKIGHFGFFKEKCKQNLWARYILPELQ